MKQEKGKYIAIAMLEFERAGAQGLTAAELSDKGGIFPHNADYALRVLLADGVVERYAEPVTEKTNNREEVFRYQLKKKERI